MQLQEPNSGRLGPGEVERVGRAGVEGDEVEGSRVGRRGLADGQDVDPDNLQVGCRKSERGTKGFNFWFSSQLVV